MKILTISDSPRLFTGLARVHRHVISALVSEGHQVLPCVWFGYDGNQEIAIAMGEKPPILEFAGTRMIAVRKKGKNMAEMNDIFDICEAFKPDVVLTIGDHTDFYYMQAIKSKLDYSFKWIAYLATEVPVVEDIQSLFSHADKVIVPSSHSKSCLAKLCCPEIVPYGIEQEFFRERTPHIGKRFVTVATNTWRKDLATLLQAIATIRDNEYFCEKLNGCFFYIHTNTYASDMSDPFHFDLKDIASRLGISDIVSFPASNSVFSGLSDADLSSVYAASDFFILPSICESFAFPAVEAMAVGIPLIGNPYGVLGEHLGDGRGIPIRTRKEFLPPAQEIDRVTIDGLAMAIVKGISLSKETYDVMSKGSTAYAREFDWRRTEKRICELVSSINMACEIPVEVL